MSSARPRIVVLGAGFAGLNAARELAAHPVDVLIVDRRNYHTFQPLLYQVATAGLNPADVAYPVRAIFRRQANVRFRQAAVEGIDLNASTVGLDDGRQEPFDHLVVAAGAQTHYFGVEGAEEYAFPLYRLGGAVQLRNHILSCFEKADADPAAVEAGVLTFCVVGGGPTGVEMAGALVELFASVLYKDYPGIDPSKARVVLVEMLPALLSMFNPRSQQQAAKTLSSRGIELKLTEQVAAVTADEVRFASGERLPCHTVVWAAGVGANPVADLFGAARGPGGRVVVEPDLSLPGHRCVWIAGDMAAATARDGSLYPQLAPVAIQEGRHVARQILHAMAATPTEPFVYHDRGKMATIGRRSAVAELRGGITLRGSIGWLSWLALHLVWLIGFRNRASVLLNWVWNYIAWERGPRVVLDVDDPEALHEHPR